MADTTLFLVPVLTIDALPPPTQRKRSTLTLDLLKAVFDELETTSPVYCVSLVVIDTPPLSVTPCSLLATLLFSVFVISLYFTFVDSAVKSSNSRSRLHDQRAKFDHFLFDQFFLRCEKPSKRVLPEKFATMVKKELFLAISINHLGC